jgi:hypothetical protein
MVTGSLMASPGGPGKVPVPTGTSALGTGVCWTDRGVGGVGLPVLRCEGE